MKQKRIATLLLILLLCSSALTVGIAAEDSEALPPDGFVYIDDIISDIKLDLRYYTDHNFVGEHIDGYLAPRGILTREAAAARTAKSRIGSAVPHAVPNPA